MLRVRKALFKCVLFFFGGVFSNLISSPLMKLEVCCILTGFSQPIVGFDVQ